MATREQLENALREAHNQGNVKDAERFAKALSELGDSGPVDFSSMEMLKNVPSSTWKLITDVATAIAHPIQTGEAVLNVGVGAAQKLLPGDFGGSGSEKYADAVGEFIKERYGSVDKFQRTLMNDPVGVLSDLALGVTGVGTGVKVASTSSKISRAAGKVAKGGMALDPINIAINTVIGAGKYIPKDFAVNMYKSAAKLPTGSMDAAERAKIIQTALDEKIMPTSSGVEKALDIVFSLNDEIEALLKQGGALGRGSRRVRTATIFKHFNDLKKQVGGKRLGAGNKLKVIQKVMDDFIKDTGGAEFITIRELQDLKKSAYEDINWKLDPKKDLTKDKAYKAAAKGAKETIVEAIPEVSDLNFREGKLLSLLNEGKLPQAAKRIGDRDLMGLGSTVSIGTGTGAGAVFGVPGAGAILGTLKAVADNPKIKARTAILANQLRKRPYAKGFVNNSPTAFALRQGLQRGGETRDIISQDDELGNLLRDKKITVGGRKLYPF